MSRALRTVHFLHGDSAGGGEHPWGDDLFCPIRETLSIGPCAGDSDPRDRFWHEFDVSLVPASIRRPRRRTSLRSKATARCIPIHGEACIDAALSRTNPETEFVFWTSDVFDDELVCWWVLNVVRRRGRASNPVWFVRLAKPATVDEGGVHAVGMFDTSEFIVQWPNRARLGARAIRTAAGLWDAFVSDDPRRLDRARREGRVALPRLARHLRTWISFFPRSEDVDGRACLRVSEYDESILDALDSQEWRRPVDVLGRVARCDEYCGELRLLHRLAEWAGQDRDNRAIEWRECDGANDFARVQYRLADRGRRILDRGLDDPSDAPTMHIGGCELYSCDRTWVWSLRDDRIGPFRRQSRRRRFAAG